MLRLKKSNFIITTTDIFFFGFQFNLCGQIKCNHFAHKAIT